MVFFLSFENKRHQLISFILDGIKCRPRRRQPNSSLMYDKRNGRPHFRQTSIAQIWSDIVDTFSTKHLDLQESTASAHGLLHKQIHSL